jgi:hypothetical protein
MNSEGMDDELPPDVLEERFDSDARAAPSEGSRQTLPPVCQPPADTDLPPDVPPSPLPSEGSEEDRGIYFGCRCHRQCGATVSESVMGVVRQLRSELETMNQIDRRTKASTN